jgi:hypothetical protein
MKCSAPQLQRPNFEQLGRRSCRGSLIKVKTNTNNFTTESHTHLH